MLAGGVVVRFWVAYFRRREPQSVLGIYMNGTRGRPKHEGDKGQGTGLHARLRVHVCVQCAEPYGWPFY